MSESINTWTEDKNMVGLGSYVGVKMENGNTAWIDPNGRVIEVDDEKNVLNSKEAEAPDEDSKVRNQAHLLFDEKMKEVFYDEFEGDSQ